MKIKQMIRKWFLKAERKKLDKVRAVARIIQDYYIEKNKAADVKETYLKAKEEIVSLGITLIVLKKNTITITLRRPGLLIGSKGENIDLLREHLKKQNQNFTINIEEDIIQDSLIPYMADDRFEDLYMFSSEG